MQGPVATASPGASLDMQDLWFLPRPIGQESAFLQDVQVIWSHIQVWEIVIHSIPGLSDVDTRQPENKYSLTCPPGSAHINERWLCCGGRQREAGLSFVCFQSFSAVVLVACPSVKISNESQMGKRCFFEPIWLVIPWHTQTKGFTPRGYHCSWGLTLLERKLFVSRGAGYTARSGIEIWRLSSSFTCCTQSDKPIQVVRAIKSIERCLNYLGSPLTLFQGAGCQPDLHNSLCF